VLLLATLASAERFVDIGRFGCEKHAFPPMKATALGLQPKANTLPC
jgi:hypothetical protein